MTWRNLPSQVRRSIWWAAGLVMAFTLGGFLVLPPIVRGQMEKRLGAALGRTVTVGAVRCNPYALSVAIENFDVREADGKSSFLSWRRLYVNFEALASLAGQWVLGDVELDELRATVQIKPDGKFNFSDLLARVAAPAASASAPAATATPAPPPGRPVRVRRLAVSEARLAFSDQSRWKPFATVVGPLTFSVTEFQTSGGSGAPYRFEARTEAGEMLGWSGTLQADPFRSNGEFRVENIPLAKYAPYHGEYLRADIADGRFGARGRYELNLAAAGRVVKLVDGAVQVRGLRVVERASQEPVVELATLDLEKIQTDALARQVEIGTIALTGASVRVRREKDGTLNLVSMIQPPPGTTLGAPAGPARPPEALASAPAAAPTPPPAITVGELSLRDCAVDVVDLAAPRQAWLGVTGLQLAVKNISLAEGATMPVQLECKWAPQGTVRVSGSFAIKPAVRATLQTEVAGLELLPLGPYLEQFVNARLTQGAFSTAGNVQLALAADGSPVVGFDGGVRLEKFGLVDGSRNEELAGVGALALEGVKATTAPEFAVAIAEVKVEAPYTRIVVNPDKALNLASLVRSPAAAHGPAPSPSAAAAAGQSKTSPPPRIEIGKVTIGSGEFSFADRSVQPAVRTTLGQFGGTIAGLSSENMTKADVALKGVVDGAGPVAITGRLDPLGAARFVDLKVDGKNVDLVAFSPYSGKYAGFELARGKLGVDVRVQVDGPKIDAANVVRLDRFTFGAPVPSPDATKLPVRLGVALLKDLEGKIVIDLPIQGRLDDPEFKIGRVIGRVLVNLLTKAAVSPFTLLGSMFGGGGEELAYQEFAPGRSELQPAEAGKLATMVKALQNRPALSLALEGSYDPAADSHALKQVKLADEVRRAIWEERRKTNPNIAPPEQLAITPAEEAAMLKVMYDQKFPPGTEFGTPLPQPPAVVKPPEPPAGFFQRLVRTLTGQARREQAAAQTENERRAAEHRKALAEALQTGRPADEMLGRLAEAIEVGAGDLEALATARAQRIRDHFIAKGAIAADRLFLAKTSDPARAGQGPRVFLSLQ